MACAVVLLAFAPGCGGGEEKAPFAVMSSHADGGGEGGSEGGGTGAPHDDPRDGGTGGTEAGGGGGRGEAGTGKTATAELPAGLSGDTPLDELTPADLRAVCDVLGARLAEAISEDDAARLACTLLALIVSTPPGAEGTGMIDTALCQQSVEECLASGLDEGTSTSACDAEGLGAAASACPVTFAEFEQCISAQIGLLGQLLDSLTCEALSDEAAAAAMATVDPTAPGAVPECARVVDECPGLLDGAGMMPPGG
jgi:hypothetical protein